MNDELKAFRDLINYAKENPSDFPVTVPPNRYGFAPDDQRIGKLYTTEMYDTGWNLVIRSEKINVCLREYDKTLTYGLGTGEDLITLRDAVIGE